MLSFLDLSSTGTVNTYLLGRVVRTIDHWDNMLRSQPVARREPLKRLLEMDSADDGLVRGNCAMDRTIEAGHCGKMEGLLVVGIDEGGDR